MSFDYARSKATADRLIDRFGRDATLLQPSLSGAGYNSEPSGETETPIRVVDLDTKYKDRADTVVLASTRTLYMSANTSAIPTKQDAVLIDGVRSQIKEVRPLQPGGVVIMWELDLH